MEFVVLFSGCASPDSPAVSTSKALAPGSWFAPPLAIGAFAEYQRGAGEASGFRFRLEIKGTEATVDALGRPVDAYKVNYTRWTPGNPIAGEIWVSPQDRLVLRWTQFPARDPASANTTYLQPDLQWFALKAFSTALFVTVPFLLAERNLSFASWTQFPILNGTLQARVRPDPDSPGGHFVDFAFSNANSWPYGPLRRESWVHYSARSAFPDRFGDGWLRDVPLTTSGNGTDRLIWLGRETERHPPIRPGLSALSVDADPVPDPSNLPLRLVTALSVARGHPEYRAFADAHEAVWVTIAKYWGPALSSSGLPEWHIQFGQIPDNSDYVDFDTIDFVVAGRQTTAGTVASVISWGKLMNMAAVSFPRSWLGSGGRANLSAVVEADIGADVDRLRLTYSILAGATTVATPAEAAVYWHREEGARPVVQRTYSAVNGQDLWSVFYYTQNF